MFDIRVKSINRSCSRVIIERVGSSFRIIFEIIFLNYTDCRLYFFEFWIFLLILSKILHICLIGVYVGDHHISELHVTYNVAWRKSETWNCYVFSSGWQIDLIIFSKCIYTKNRTKWKISIRSDIRKKVFRSLQNFLFYGFLYGKVHKLRLLYF